MKKYFVSKSRMDGTGVFAARGIKRGEIILNIKGEPKHWIVKDKKSSEAGPNWIGLGKNLWLDVREPAVFLNHSCAPNAGIRGRVQLVALKDIKAGEEIHFDYSVTEEDKLWEMNCKCGTSLCRKKIKSIQFLPKDVFRKYGQSIPRYFASVYRKEVY